MVHPAQTLTLGGNMTHQQSVYYYKALPPPVRTAVIVDITALTSGVRARGGAIREVCAFDAIVHLIAYLSRLELQTQTTEASR